MKKQEARQLSLPYDYYLAAHYPFMSTYSKDDHQIGNNGANPTRDRCMGHNPNTKKLLVPTVPVIFGDWLWFCIPVENRVYIKKCIVRLTKEPKLVSDIFSKSVPFVPSRGDASKSCQNTSQIERSN